jgi:hypothetical protein
VNVVDDLLVRLSNFIFGDLSRHGIVRPKIGPLLLKARTGRSAVIDVGTVGLIKKGVIKVSIFPHTIKKYRINSFCDDLFEFVRLSL